MDKEKQLELKLLATFLHCAQPKLYTLLDLCFDPAQPIF